MGSIGERLREERDRLGLSQEALGAIGGVKKLAQRNYEKGNRIPDAAYLAALTEAGVDVTYVLTGGRVKEDAQQIREVSQRLAVNQYYHEQLAKELGVGEKSGEEQPESLGLCNDAERELLDLYRRSTLAGRGAILATARAVEKAK